MKPALFFPLFIALAFFGSCPRRASNEMVKVMSKQVAAEQAAKQSKHLAEKIRLARLAKDWRQVSLLEKESIDTAGKISQALEDIRAAKPAFVEETERTSVAKVEKTIEGHLLGTNLEREIEEDAVHLETELADDVARMETKEGQSLREQCLGAIRGIPKADVCFYLKTYVSAHRAPTEEEWETHTQKTAVKCLLKLPSGFSQRNSARSLMKAIEEAPDNLLKLEVAAGHLACMLLK